MACVVAATSFAGRAAAYPTSIIFAPTGEVRRLGEVSHIGYVSMIASPRAAPGVSWFANEVGVLPLLPFGESGVSFGGLEVGIDAYNADLFATPNAYVKPLVNAKVQLLTEHAWVPATAIGFITAPFQASRSQNALFFALTKSLDFGETKLGRVTLGLAHYYTNDRTVFYGSQPLFEDKHSGFIGGYESPALGRFSFAIDHVGGVGEINSTNAAISVTPFDGASVALGAFLANDRRTEQTRIDGAFAAVFITWSVIKAFATAPPPPPAALPP